MAKNDTVAAPEGVNTLAGSTDEDFENGFGDAEEEAQERELARRAELFGKDPTMDPGSPRWNPKKYFARQEKVVITIIKNESDILADPSGQRPVMVPVSINGYRLDIQKGVPTRVPKDFADHLIDIGAAYRDADSRAIKDVS